MSVVEQQIAPPSRPALRYFGGKWRIAPWIISFFPEHICYVEPFMGAGSVLLRKPPSTFEYLNDKDDAVVNFFQVLRDHKDELLRQIRQTPFARRELELSYSSTSTDPIERARLVYVRCWQGRSGSRLHKTGWRNQIRPSRNKTALRGFIDDSHLDVVAARLREVGLECGDYQRVIERYDAPTTLFYADPPYLGSLRSTIGYRFDLKQEEEHRNLAEVFREVAGMVVLSGYQSSLYAELFEEHGWARRDRKARMQSGEAVESVWLNPNTLSAHTQLDLFRHTEPPNGETE